MMLRPLFLVKYKAGKALRIKLKELESDLSPYLKFWGAWVKADDCFLTSNEIAFLNGIILNQFSVSSINSETLGLINKIDLVKEKLRLQFDEFKTWLGYGFITTIIRLRSESGSEYFLITPIKKLTLNEELKSALLKFGTNNLSEIFEKYSEEDFKKDWMHKILLEIEDALNKSGKSLFMKSHRLNYELKFN